TYTVVQNGCPSTAQADITVVAAPEAQFLNLPPELCIGETITLQASPAGGTFSGPGVSGNILDTSSLPEGIITLSYLYTNNNNCSDTALAQVFVKNCAGEPASDGSTQGVVFQNPVRNSQLWLQGSLVSHISRIRFTDFQGRSVPLRVVRVGDSLQIDLSAANEGVYVLELLTKQGTAYCQKIVILEHH
ncbi:MAG: T9SS type A sorting domain-containing protein, partial [Flavobacteriales bacterium]|nr:T9SS type A sorting domain-containing protein [Flavobacteriales bacterium]